jgi:lipoate-protein ligase A
MYLLELTLPTPAENVALDEALLDAAEAGEIDGPVLRLWESVEPLVVIGRSSRVSEEVDLAACQAKNIKVIRRASGGAAVVVGPGCLMYSVVMPYAGREHLRLLDELHRDVLGALGRALQPLAPDVEHVGTCDLAIGGRKFSGNAVRCKRDHFLYHGTLLYNFDLTLIETLLLTPPRQPEYRAKRRHADFMRNLAVSRSDLEKAMVAAWQACQLLSVWPNQRTMELVSTRYSLESWNLHR